MEKEEEEKKEEENKSKCIFNDLPFTKSCLRCCLCRARRIGWRCGRDSWLWYAGR